MKNWFNIKFVADDKQRTLGVILRVFGIDFTVMLLGWLNDWMLFDIRFPVNNGIYTQVWFLLASIGRLPTSTFDREE